MADLPPLKRPRMMKRHSSIVLARQRTGVAVESIAAATLLPSLKRRESVAGACEMFRRYDADGNGVLDYGEFRRLMHKVGKDQERLNESYIEHVISIADKNRDGSISLEEFEEVFGGIRKMDALLHAPRPQAAAVAEQTPEDRSILREEPELVCPAVNTVPFRAAREAEDDDGEDDVDVHDGAFLVDDRFTDLRWLGQGGFGLVCSATDRRDGTRVAIKRIRPTSDTLLIKCCLRELAILHHYGMHPHDNVMGLKEVLRPPGGRHLAEWRDLYVVCELMETDLQKLIKADRPLSAGHIQIFTWQLLRGVHGLHASGVLHRDIKPSNLLVSSSGELKITDFGISRSCHPYRAPSREGAAADANSATAAAAATVASSPTKDDEGDSNGKPLPDGAAAPGGGDIHATAGRIVTLWYRPPELLCGNATYGTAVDMWSVGIVIAEMLGRAPPFYVAEGGKKEHLQMLRQIVPMLGRPSEDDLATLEVEGAVAFLRKISKEANVPDEPIPWSERYEDAPPLGLDLVERLVRFNATRRPSALEALRHAWLDGFHDESDLDERPQRCGFPFDAYPDPHLDHFLIAALDAVKWKLPDYPLAVSERQRFETYGRAPAREPALEWEGEE